MFIWKEVYHEAWALRPQDCHTQAGDPGGTPGRPRSWWDRSQPKSGGLGTRTPGKEKTEIPENQFHLPQRFWSTQDLSWWNDAFPHWEDNLLYSVYPQKCYSFPETSLLTHPRIKDLNRYLGISWSNQNVMIQLYKINCYTYNLQMGYFHKGFFSFIIINILEHMVQSKSWNNTKSLNVLMYSFPMSPKRQALCLILSPSHLCPLPRIIITYFKYLLYS